jgi:hypothetical protein
MFLSAVIIGSLALWIVLWALGLAALVSFLVALVIILPSVALHVVRSGSGSGA